MANLPHQVYSATQYPSAQCLDKPANNEHTGWFYFGAYPLAAGLLQWVPVNLIGTLPVTEIVTLALAPLLFLKGSFSWLKQPKVGWILFGLAIWFAALILSDILNSTPIPKRQKGMANVFFIALSFLTFTKIFSVRPRAYLLYVLGLSAGGWYRPLFTWKLRIDDAFGSAEFFDNYISYWAIPLTLLISYFLYPRRKLMTELLFVSLGILAIYWGGRSTGFMCIGTSALLFAARSGREIRLKSLLPLLLIATPFVIAAYIAFVSLGLRGNLGLSTERQLRNCDNPYNPIELVYQARRDFWMGAEAALEKPIFGWGSKPESGRYLNRERKDLDEIPAHSVLIQAWLSAGIAAFLFWICILPFFATVPTIKFAPYTAFTPIIFYCCCSALWNIPFSPWGYARFEWPYAMALTLVITNRYSALASHSTYLEPKVPISNPVALHSQHFVRSSRSF
jgi:hypothetical protein